MTSFTSIQLTFSILKIFLLNLKKDMIIRRVAAPKNFIIMKTESFTVKTVQYLNCFSNNELQVINPCFNVINYLI
jgi:hypothetical protein